MNPDKLFDYLDGRLPDWERSQLEKQIEEDPQLQKEFAAARRIHSSMRGDSREIIIPDETEATERGRKMALRVGTAFVILVAVNVAAGLFFIARHEAGNPNRQLLQQQAQEQFLASARRAAAGLTAAPLATDLNIAASPGQLEGVAEQVVMAAQRLGGSATKGLPDGHGLAVLVDVPASRGWEFRAALTTLGGATSSSPSPNESLADTGEKKSFVVHVMETASP
jgi:anti-sigma factor RsiW